MRYRDQRARPGVRCNNIQVESEAVTFVSWLEKPDGQVDFLAKYGDNQLSYVALLSKFWEPGEMEPFRVGRKYRYLHAEPGADVAVHTVMAVNSLYALTWVSYLPSYGAAEQAPSSIFMRSRADWEEIVTKH